MWVWRDILELFVKGKMSDHISMDHVWLSMLIMKHKFSAHIEFLNL